MDGLNAPLEGGRRVRGEAAGRPGAPLVSIVTVVYNGAATLERTLRSVLDQRHPAIEHIVVDGGSTDGTVDLLRRYDDRLAYWVSAKDRGIYDAMNKGVALCTGEWVGLINADDWYAADAVDQVVTAVRDRPGVNIVHGDILIHYPGDVSRVKRARLNGFLLKHWEMVLNHPTFFVRRSYYAGRPFDPELRVSGDHQWTLRAWLEDPGQFLYLPRVLAHFTAGGASMTIPLRKVLREGARVSRSVGMGPLGVFVGQAVRTALFVPQILKLKLNQYLGRRR
ncbi:MAG TPA: glycosyltransferase family 2 protein [Flavobacteriales bacterium]|nr:glycosyltransferase family 2 protein [Flavobacteriales bacterium]HMR27519.1 glycosyltransferase family 2 protein [Flavobacteriales bacterium]